jgi:hypothetical protein
MCSVSASWTQPTASCTAGSQYAAFWVALDGYTSFPVNYTGTGFAQRFGF